MVEMLAAIAPYTEETEDLVKLVVLGDIAVDRLDITGMDRILPAAAVELLGTVKVAAELGEVAKAALDYYLRLMVQVFTGVAAAAALAIPLLLVPEEQEVVGAPVLLLVEQQALVVQV
jgi:hypothetical protein